MNKLLFYLTFATTVTLPFTSKAQCAETSEEKIMLVGDSWAFFMGADQTINKVLTNWGHSGYSYYTNLTIAENGAETDDFLLATKQTEIATRLAQKPSIKAIHLSIGGNDFLGSWNTSFTSTQVDSLADAVFGRLDSVIVFLKGLRPDLHIVWSGYAYPNFGEVIGGMTFLQTSHPFYSRWQAMGFPTFAELNTILNTFSDRFTQTYQNDSRITFIPAMAYMQYAFGQTTPLAVAPGGTYAPNTVALPYGDINYPSPKITMRDYGVTRDCFHLSGDGYLAFIGYQAQKFYQKFLMDDTYAIALEQQTGSISSNGSISNQLYVGKNNGESFTGMLGFNVVMPDTALDKVSVFLKIEEIIGDPLLDNEITLSLINGHFGTTTTLEVADLASSGSTDVVCTFGSKTLGNWVRFDLPTTLFSEITNGNLQAKLTANPATNALIRFANGTDNDFQPVLNLKYGTANLSTKKITPTSVKVYPNPTQDQWIIQSEQPITNVRVMDITGRNIAVSIHNNQTIDAHPLPQGIYVISYDLNGENYAQKVMKM